MSSDRQHVEASGELAEAVVFSRALGLRGAERAAYLSEACAGRPDLRQRVEELLEEEASVARGFLETPAVLARPGDTAIVPAPVEEPGDRIDRFKLLQKIGEGGCGVVYLAEQELPVRRRVALKVIKLGMDTKSVIARFEAERQALAMMDHPNIAKVFEAGATETGRPYFVMELVRGVSITEYCDENRLPARSRLELFVQVCLAIQHAHQKGVIHRDIKPSNILVTLHDGVAVPKVIDFGIAKATDQRLTDKTLFTEFHAFIGTPAYTSPEQAEMSNQDVDTRSDLYSLGVLLYELLIGRTPFESARLLQSSLHEMRRIIIEEEPPPPSVRLSAMTEVEETGVTERCRMKLSALKETVRGDLDWVVMKCLEKDRTRRYATAQDLAADVQRYLDNEPVLARPPSNVYRLRKLLRKHRAACVAVAGVAAALVLGVAVSLWQAVKATRAQQDAVSARLQESVLRAEAEEERERAQRGESAARLSMYVADINLARHSLRDGNLGRAMALLSKHVPAEGEVDLRGFEWRYLRDLCRGDEHESLPSMGMAVAGVSFSPTGAWLAVNAGGRLHIWDRRKGAWVATLPKGASSMAFLPGDESLVTVNVQTLRILETADWTERRSLSGYSAPLELSGDGRFAVCMKRVSRIRREAVVWETGGWTELGLLGSASEPFAFSADGSRIAARTREGIGIWAVAELDRERVSAPMQLLEGATNLWGAGMFQGLPASLAISPDGGTLAAARNTLSERGVFVVGLWDMDSGREVGTMPADSDHIEHTGPITHMTFSPDGGVLATASEDYSIRLWDMTRRERLGVLQGHSDEASAVAFSPDGRTIASGDKAGGIKLWPAQLRSREDLLPGNWQPISFSADGSILAVMSGQNSVAFLDMETREPIREFHLETGDGRRFGPVAVGLNADLRLLAFSTRGGVVQILDTVTGETNLLETGERRVDFLALSPEGRVLVTGARGRALRLWDRLTGEGRVLDTEAHQVQFSHDGQTLAAVQWDKSLQLWDVPSATLRTNVVLESGVRFGLAFSRDDTLVAVACRDDAVRLLETSTGRVIGACTGHKQWVFSVAFSPDGRTLATSSDDSTLKLWNVATQQELLSDRRHGSGTTQVLFSPNGQLLVSGSTLFSQTTGLRFYHAPAGDGGMNSASCPAGCRDGSKGADGVPQAIIVTANGTRRLDDHVGSGCVGCE